MTLPKELGLTISRPAFNIFYGNKYFTEKILKASLPNVCLLNQVHGRQVVNSSLEIQTADGHSTNLCQRTLVIKTADCLPVFYSSRGRVIGLHIGWRGLEKKILSHSLNINPIDDDSELFVGPHIQMSSFDLDHDNLQLLLKSHSLTWEQAKRFNMVVSSGNRPHHFFVNLSLILIHEAKKVGFKNFNISNVNTYSSFEHYSFRRNRIETQRNFSLIFRHNGP